MLPPKLKSFAVFSLFFVLWITGTLFIVKPAVATCNCSSRGFFPTTWTTPDSCFADSACTSPCTFAYSGAGSPPDLTATCTPSGGGGGGTGGGGGGTGGGGGGTGGGGGSTSTCECSGGGTNWVASGACLTNVDCTNLCQGEASVHFVPTTITSGICIISPGGTGGGGGGGGGGAPTPPSTPIVVPTTQALCEKNDRACCLKINPDCMAAFKADEHNFIKSDMCYCCGNCGFNDIVNIFLDAANYLFTILGALALLFFIYGGVIWLTAGGSAGQIDKGKKILIGAVIGVALALGAWLIIQFLITALGVTTNVTGFTPTP